MNAPRLRLAGDYGIFLRTIFAGKPTMNFEQELKAFLSARDVRFVDRTGSHSDLDFTLTDADVHFDAKEKKQRFAMRHWTEANIPEKYFFILDDLSARKILLRSPRSFLLIRDSSRGAHYYVFSIVDLLCIPKKRVRRILEGNTTSFKGKWLIDLRHGKAFDELDAAVKFMTEYPKNFERIFKDHIDCWGEYEGENIPIGGTPRTKRDWAKDLKSKS